MVSRVLASSLAGTTPWLTVSSELTTPGGPSQVGDRGEEGFVLDPATLVLGDEDLDEEDVLETILVLGMKTPAKWCPESQRPLDVLQRRRGEALQRKRYSK